MSEQDILEKLSKKYDSKQLLNLIKLDKKNGPIYRTLSKSSYKESFLNGQLRISTLDACRNLENETAKDINEGKLIAHISNLHIDNTNNNQHFNNLDNLKKMGIHIENSSNIQVSNINSHMILDDAYVLCFSTEITKYHNANYGKYTICINYPNVFAYIVYENIRHIHKIFEYKCQVVNYGNQKADIVNSLISEHLGFHKTIKFEPEKEFRMLFKSDSYNLSPFIISIPEISLLCKNFA